MKNKLKPLLSKEFKNLFDFQYFELPIILSFFPMDICIILISILFDG